jgi:Cupredoxin-like domain
MRTIIISVIDKGIKNVMLRWILLIALMSFAVAAQALEYEAKLAIHDHKFDPVTLTVPANTKIKLLVENQDATPEEFESSDLNREKVVIGKGTITVLLGPLDAGKYHFFGDFHQETAQGDLVVK